MRNQQNAPSSSDLQRELGFSGRHLDQRITALEGWLGRDGRTHGRAVRASRRRDSPDRGRSRATASELDADGGPRQGGPARGAVGVRRNPCRRISSACGARGFFAARRAPWLRPLQLGRAFVGPLYRHDRTLTVHGRLVPCVGFHLGTEGRLRGTSPVIDSKDLCFQ